MSLYNMVNGTNPAAVVLLDMIGIEYGTIPRFRDIWIDEEFKEITLLTRTGGGNRDDYAVSNDELTDNPLYLHDEDDDFDSTFAKFTYRVTDEMKARLLKDIDDAGLTEEQKENLMAQITKTNTKKWAETMAALNKS